MQKIAGHNNLKAIFGKQDQPMLSLTKIFADPGVVALVSDRAVDFSLNGKMFFLDAQQKDVLLQHTGVGIERVAWARQVHGVEIVSVKEDFFNADSLCVADGLLTRQAGLPIAIRTADCLPVFIFDPKNKAIGLVHAGWRGSHKGILRLAIEQMKELWGTQSQDLKIAFGPSIRSCCYQVGEEFQEYFPQEIQHRKTALYLDLARVNCCQALAVGVKEKNIFDCGICTCCSENLFSYRREGAKAGRMISLMMLKKN